MNFKEVTVWVEAHPGESILIGGGGLLILLWLLGYFSPSASAPAQDPLATAYYAAEAQQAVVAGQIQQTTLTTAAQTAQTGIQANAAVAINAAQAQAATTINSQNTDAATTILGADPLLATYSNNATALSTVQSNNAAQVQMNAANNMANNFQSLTANVIPLELQLTSGAGSLFTMPGFVGGEGGVGSPTSINRLLSLGYTKQQAAVKAGVPPP
jgi:hypothetical protein